MKCGIGKKQDIINAPILSIPQAVFNIIMWYATPENNLVPANTRLVCHRFKQLTELSGILQYNQATVPQFCFETDGRNLAVEKQHKEIVYLLENEANINEANITDKNFSAIIIDCFARLEASVNIEPVSRQFIERELILDRLAISIIEAKIKESQRCDPKKLACASCYLTRFPGKLITRPEYQVYWRGLEGLWLSYNKLQSLPKEIGQLRALQGLWLNNNQLQCLRAEIGQLGGLLQLHLNDNQLQILPKEIGQFGALQELWLNNNQLLSLPPEIGQLGALQELHLNDNQLENLPAEIGRLGALEYLHLYNNKLSSLPENLRESILRDSTLTPTTKAQVLTSQNPPSASQTNKVKHF